MDHIPFHQVGGPSRYSILIPLYSTSVSAEHDSEDRLVSCELKKNTPTALKPDCSNTFNLNLKLDGFPSNDRHSDPYPVHFDMEEPLVRYISRPLVSTMIFSLDSADDRITNYSTQFLKALFFARSDIVFRQQMVTDLRNATRVRGLRARIFEYARTNLDSKCRSIFQRPRVSDPNILNRDHLNCVLDFLHFCLCVPLNMYTSSQMTVDFISLQQLVESYCVIIVDCLQTLGSGLGMNAGAADGIYSQNHLVCKLLRCLNVLMNTSVHYDWFSSSQNGECRKLSEITVVAVLRHLAMVWPHAAPIPENPVLPALEKNCIIHRLEMISLSPTNAQDRELERCIDADSDAYLAARINSPNAVREEAFLSIAFESLCCHACVHAYEAHNYQFRKVVAPTHDLKFDFRSSLLVLNSQLDTAVDRILAKIVRGVQAQHFKISLKSISCFKDKEMCLLRRYFLPVPDEAWACSSEDGFIAEAYSTTCRFNLSCIACEQQRRRREVRLDNLVSALRSARSTHWNSRVRESAGDLLDILMELLI